MTSPDSTWHPGIGDPTPIGWLTVAAYFLAAWACWRAFAAADTGSGARFGNRFWLLLAVALGLLGINKQLDLQTALTEIGRSVVHAGGWYEQRQAIQFAFIVGVAVSAVGVLAAMTWLLWPPSPSRAFALCGLIFLVGFVMIRAASFHHVDLFLGQTALGLRWNWILELSGIGLVGAGAMIETGIGRRRC